MWVTVETSLGEIRMEKAEGGKSKGRGREKKRGERQEKEAEKRENSGSKESGGRMGDLG